MVNHKELGLATIIRYLIYVTALVPLIIFSQYMSPFHFGKVIVFRSLVELMLAAYIILVCLDRKYLPRMNRIVWSFIFFTLAFTITTITSSQVYQSFWGTLERMGGLWTFWHYLVFFIILISIFRKKEDWISLFRIMIGAGILSAIYGFGQKTDISFFIGGGGRTRIFGTIGNAALFAGYQILIYFLALTMFLHRGESWRWRIFYGVTVLFTGLAVLMTAVRGSILGIGLGTFVFAFLYFWQNKTVLSRKIFYGIVIFILLFIVFAFGFKNSSFVKNSGYLSRITNFSLKNYTVQTRFWAWQAGLKGWSESPRRILLGWGPENFNIPFSKYFNPKFYNGPGSETLFDRAHNMFVEVLVTMGLMGFLAYVFIFVSILMALIKKLKETSENRLFAIGFIALTLAYIIHNAFIFDTSANFITFFSILGFISYISYPTDQVEDKNNSDRPRFKLPTGLVGFISLVLAISVIILIYKTNILPVYANYAATRAIVAGWNGNFDGAIAKFKESVNYDVPGKYEFRNRLGQYVLEIGMGNYKKFPNYPEAIKYTISEIKKNEADFPIDYLPKLYLSRLNIMLGKDDPQSPYNDEALKESMGALALSKTFVRTYYEVAQVYLNKKDYVTARDYFQKAVDLNPDVGLSYWYLALTEFQLKNSSKAREFIDLAIQKNAPLSEIDYLKIVTVYLDDKDYNKIIWAYEKLIQISPSEAKYFASLAAAYAKIGKIDDAVKNAKRAAAIDPSFEAEARRFVVSIGGKW